jgi:hypothetical protein
MFTSPKGSDDIYSVSDQGLADTFKFVEEVAGFSLPHYYQSSFIPRSVLETGEASGSASRALDTVHPMSRKTTTISRSQTKSQSRSCIATRRQLPRRVFAHCTQLHSLPPPPHSDCFNRWNEMKVVRSLKYDPHPSIIPFYNFIITPSYALISMSVDQALSLWHNH